MSLKAVIRRYRFQQGCHWGFYDAREKLGTMIEVTNFDEVKAIEAAQNK